MRHACRLDAPWNTGCWNRCFVGHVPLQVQGDQCRGWVWELDLSGGRCSEPGLATVVRSRGQRDVTVPSHGCGAGCTLTLHPSF